MSEVWQQEGLRALAVAVGFLGLFAAAEAWRALGDPPVEWTRKLVHFGAGAGVAVFPWIFTSHWTVLVLSLAFIALLAGTRKLGLLRSVHGVSRQSEGGVYYPMAVYLLFLIGAGRPVFYLISVLALVLSDALAALVGSSYGRIRYQVEDDTRSLEGSLVFFTSTFMGAHLPLLLLTDMDRAASVAVGLQVALLVTLFEAISLRGNDNLVVPLITYYLLVKMTPKSAAWIFEQLLLQVAVMLFVVLLGLRTGLFATSGVLAASLFLYAALSLGGWWWGAAPLLVVGAQAAWAARRGRLPTARHQVLGVFWVCLVPSVLLVLDNAMGTLVDGGPAWEGDPLYGAYVAAVAAHLALFAVAVTGVSPPAAAAGAWVLVVPLSLAVGPRGLTPGTAGMALATVLLAALLYSAWHRRVDDPLGRLHAQAASVGCVTAALWLPWLALAGML